MKTVAVALTSAVVSTLLAGCASASAPSQPTAASGIAATAPAVHTVTSDASGFDTHSFWFDTGREVVVVDGQFTPALASAVLDDIRAATKNPVRWLVITHPNPDKFNGASVFRTAGAKVVASASTARAMPGVHAYKKAYFVGAGMFTDATYPALATVDVTFDRTFDLPLEGDAKVELRELSHAGVSTTQTVVAVPGARALFVGDLVHNGAHAWLEGGIRDGRPSPDLDSWRSALDELLVFDRYTVYGGRGTAAPVAAAVASQKDYLEGMGALVHDYVAELGPRKSELASPGASAHFKAIAAKAKAAYPDRALDYLVEYGVYGLALREANLGE